MAGDKKFAILEVNGEELFGPVESYIDCVDLIDNAGSAAYTISNDLVTAMTLYSSTTQVIANRTASVAYTYNGDDQPTQEVWTIYSTADGTTVLRTTTVTHTWSGDNITKTEVTSV